MVTNLKEGNKRKCEQYWPETGSTTYGPFKVTLTEQQVFADYNVRTMQVSVSRVYFCECMLRFIMLSKAYYIFSLVVILYWYH